MGINVKIDGKDVECAVISIFDNNEYTYIALLPQIGNADEIILFRYKVLPGDSIDLINIDDEKEFQSALLAFDKLMKDTNEG